MANASVNQEFSEYLEFKKGTSNKFYEVSVKPDGDGYWRFTARYGRIGANGRVKDYGRSTWAYAVVSAETQINKKLGKGYKKADPLSALASALQEPEERKLKGKPPHIMPIPHWFIDTPGTIERLDKWAKKFLSKVNLVRASYYELSHEQHRDQITTVFTSARDEFQRIKKTKAHGAAVKADHRTETAAAVFFNDLRDREQVYVYWPQS